MRKRKLYAAKTAAMLLIGLSAAGLSAFGVYADDSLGLKGSYIGIGSAPADDEIVKTGHAAGLNESGVVDYRPEMYIDRIGDNADGEGVKWGFNTGLFAGGYGAYTSGSFSTALGTYAGAETGSTAIGAGAFAMNTSVSLGKNAYAMSGYRTGAVAAGANAMAGYGVAVGYNAEAGRFYKYVQPNSVQVLNAEASVAIGNYAKATGGVAVGTHAASGGLYGTAVGDGSSAGYSGVALGANAQVTAQTGIALGIDAVANRESGSYGYVPFADDTKASVTPTDDARLISAISAPESVKSFSTTYAKEIAEYNQLESTYHTAAANAAAQENIMQATKGSAKPEEQQQYIDAKAAYDTYTKEAAAATNKKNDWLGNHAEFVKAKNDYSNALLTYKSKQGALSVGITGRETRQIINLAAGTEDTDAVNVAQLKRVAEETEKKANLDAGNLTDGNVSSWQNKLGNGTVAENNTGLVTGGTVYNALQEKADTDLGNITQGGKTVISNIAKESVKVIDGTNTTVKAEAAGDVMTYAVNVSNEAIKAAVKDDLAKKADVTYVDGELDKKADKDTVAKIDQAVKDNTANIANKADKAVVDQLGQTVQTNKDNIDKKADKDAANLSDSDVKSWQDKLGNGKNAAGDTGLITGDTLNKAISAIDVSSQIVNKADTDAGNLSNEDISKWQDKFGSGTVAKDDTGLVTGGTVHAALEKKADKTVVDQIDQAVKTNTANIDKKADKDAGNLSDGDVKSWQNTLGNGTVAKDDTGLVTGGTVHAALQEKADTDLGNINKDGKTVISNIAKESVKVVDGTNTTVKAAADGDVMTYAVNVSNDSIKAAVKDDLDKKADVTYVDNGLTKKADKDAANLNAGDVTSWRDKLGVTDLTGQVNGLGNRINRLDTRIDRVGAGAAALAALHPLDFDPDDKLDIAAGYGNYGSANAFALGAFYRPNTRTMFSVGGSMGGGENLLNVGVSLKLGKGSPYSGYSRVALTSVIAEQKATIGKLEHQVASQQKQIEDILQQLAALKK